MKTVLSNTGVVIWGSGTDSVTRTDFNTAFQNLEDRAAVAFSGARPAPSKARRIHYDAGTKRFSYDTGTEWVAIGGTTDEVAATASGPTKVAATFSGAANQSGNLTEWKDSTGTVLARIGASGSANFPEVSIAGSYGSIFASPSAANRVPLFVKGAAGQSASLSQWQNSAGTTLASLGANGDFSAASLASAGVLSAAGKATLKELAGTFATFAPETDVQALTVKAQNGWAANMQAFDVGGTIVARMAGGGQSVVSSLVVGSALTNGNAPVSGKGAVFVQGSITNLPTMRVEAPSGQTASLLEITKGASNFATLASDGSFAVAGKGTFPGGVYNGTPLAMNGKIPAMEIITGTETGAFTDEVVFRHTATATGAAARISRLAFKLGTESALDANKGTAIGVYATGGSSTLPQLTGWQAGQVAFQFNTDLGVTFAGDISAKTRLEFTDATAAQKISLNPSKTVGLGNWDDSLYARYSNSFYLMKGGSHAYGSATLGGSVQLSVNATGLLRNEGGISGVTLRSDGKVFAGDETYLDNHLLAAFDSDALANFGVLNIQTNIPGKSGGSVNIGNASSTTNLSGTVKSTAFYVNNHRIWVGPFSPASPVAGDVWIQV